MNISEIPCTVRNQDQGGADLQLPPATVAPDHFLLYVPVDGTAYRCVVRWREKDKIGVQFAGTEAKPWWHYG